MKLGRKTKLTKALITRLGKELAKCPPEYACPVAGISHRTFMYWKKDAENLIKSIESGEIDEDSLDERQQLLLHFLHTAEHSKAKLEMEILIPWMEAARGWVDKNTGKINRGNWKAGEALLAKMNPRTFGNTLPQEPQAASNGEGESGVIEAPSLPFNDDPASAFMQAASSQQKSTTELANSKQREKNT